MVGATALIGTVATIPVTPISAATGDELTVTFPVEEFRGYLQQNFAQVGSQDCAGTVLDSNDAGESFRISISADCLDGYAIEIDGFGYGTHEPPLEYLTFPDDIDLDGTARQIRIPTELTNPANGRIEETNTNTQGDPIRSTVFDATTAPCSALIFEVESAAGTFANRDLSCVPPGCGDLASVITADNPSAWWRFSNGAPLSDSAGTFDLAGTVVERDSFIPAVVDGAVGSTQLSTTGTVGSGLFPNGDFTIETWVSADQPWSLPTITAGQGVTLGVADLDGGGFLDVTVQTTTGTLNFFEFIDDGGTELEAVHLALRVEGNLYSVFVNGNLERTTASTGTIDWGTGTQTLELNAFDTFSPIDELAIYGSALSDERIAAHTDTGACNEPSGPVATPLDPLALGDDAGEVAEVINFSDDPSAAARNCVVRVAQDVPLASTPTACFTNETQRDLYLDANGLLDGTNQAQELLGTHYDSIPSPDVLVTATTPSLAVVADDCLVDVSLRATFWDDRFSATRGGCDAIVHYSGFAEPTPPFSDTGTELATTGLGIAPLGAISDRVSALRYLPLAPPATDPGPTQIRTLLLGDSYAAGNGARTEAGDEAFVGPEGCFRSTENWASIYRDFLQDQGFSMPFTNNACSGAVTTNLTGDYVLDSGTLPPQLDAVTPEIDLVLLSIGGNDLGFSSIATDCLVEFDFDQILAEAIADDRLRGRCQDSLSSAELEVGRRVPQSTYGRIVEILDEIYERSDGNAVVAYVDYPHLIRNRPGLTSDPYVFEDLNVGERLENLQLAGQQLQLEAVLEANNNAGVDFVNYVTGNKEEFATHELVAPFPSDEPGEEWFVDVSVTNGIFASADEFVHPNRLGHLAYARVVATGGTYGAETTPAVPLDVVFVVNATESEAGSAEAFADQAGPIFDIINERTSLARFGIVSYRDFPSETGISSDYPFQREISFTTNRQAFVSAANIESSGGGATPDSVLSGINEALQFSWRNGAAKHIVLVGEASPYAVEPEGLTAAVVGNGAYQLDPAEIHVVANSSEFSPSILQLVEESGGFILPTPSNFVGLGTQGLIDSLINKPVANAGGPYLTTPNTTITLDARGSIDTQTSIVEYQWDLDGDRTYETTTTSATLDFATATEFQGTIGVRVIDTQGWSHIATTSLTVSTDGDTIPTAIDNCPDVANQDQFDRDNDGEGDACDPLEPANPTTDICADLTPTIEGTDASETINGTPGDDIIFAYGGNDKINGKGGNDIVCAGEGNDTINLQDGDDIVDTGPGNDKVNAKNGDNTIYALEGNNTINGGNGVDVVIAGPGNDVANTKNGDDVIDLGDGDNTANASNGNDDVTTGAGTDVLNLGNGNDTASAGSGDDRINAGSGTDDVNGGDGTDTCFGEEIAQSCEL